MKPVNLNQVRKAKARDNKRALADANSVKFGLKQVERERMKTAATKGSSHLDGHKLDK